MAKKINKNVSPGTVLRQGQPTRPQSAFQKTQPAEEPFVPDPTLPPWIYKFWVHAALVALVAFGFYANTFSHEYALDDTIVIAKNEYVYEGLGGLGSIFTKDAFDSYYKQFNSSNQLAGGRYRPLSIATFAVEQQFLGPIPQSKVDSVVQHAGELGKQEQTFIGHMHVRHVLNVLWYALSVIVLLTFLREVVFRRNPFMALVAALLFAAHPIHTEVVANVKSRDEIMSLMFICLTFIYGLRYHEKKDKKWLIWGLVCYVLAFLSKEYAISLGVLMPLAFYVFKRFSISESLLASLPYLAIVAVYAVLRFSIVQPMSEDSKADILNNPYAWAEEQEKSEFATKVSTTLNYLKLVLVPHPLSADYSYNSIPYKDATSPQVWLSVIVHIGLIVLMFYYVKRRHVIGFGIAFYLANLLLICNLLFNIGGTMGERLIYHSSVGFAIVVAYLLCKGAEMMKPAVVGRVVVAGCLVVAIGLYGFKTIDRNKYWKNDQTLFFEDIKVQPNSVLVNADVASSYVNNSELKKTDAEREADVHKGIWYFSRAIEINPKFVSGYLNRGMAYFKLKKPDSAFYNLDMVRQLYPRYPKLGEMMYNVGVNFYVEKKYSQAIVAWKTCLSLDNPPQIKGQAQNALNVLASQGIFK